MWLLRKKKYEIPTKFIYCFPRFLTQKIDWKFFWFLIFFFLEPYKFHSFNWLCLNMQLIVFISIGFLCVALESDITLKAMGTNPVKIFFYFSKFSFFHSLFLKPDSVNSKVFFFFIKRKYFENLAHSENFLMARNFWNFL